MSPHWPTYEEWLRTLSRGDQERARALAERFRSLGAQDPEGWARSEIAEGIPQLARFLVLNAIKKHALDYWELTGVLDEAAKEHEVFDRVLKHLRQSGFRDADIGAFAQKVAAITAWQVVHVLDEGYDIDAEDKLPGWAVEERDADGERTGRGVGGLHESFYEFDPTRPPDDVQLRSAPEARKCGARPVTANVGRQMLQGAKMPALQIPDSLSVVTGASSGIGEATARLLASRGSHVCLLARNADRLAAISEDIRKRGGKADAFAVDLADPQALAATAKRVLSVHGSPHILINNAGAGRWLPILQTSADEAAQMMSVPYLAAFNITRELLPGMLARRSGHIVNVTSVAARLAWPGAVAYAAARAAMEGFTNALRADVYGSGLSVTLAMFGTVETSYWEHNPGSRERLPRQAAGIRTLNADQVASAIVTGIEKGARTIVEPAAFKRLFLLNWLFPKQTEESLCKRS